MLPIIKVTVKVHYSLSTLVLQKCIKMSSKRVHYDAAMKRKVILYAEKNGNRAAEREFTISEANIRRWRKDKNLIFSCKATLKCFTGPKKGRYPQVDETVLQFVIDTRSKGLPVTRQTMQLKALEAATNNGINTFKATRGWCDRFMRRQGLSLRRRTSICQKIPIDFETKLVNFQRYIIELHKNRNYSFSQIGNADETPVCFDMPRNYTVNSRGAKEIKIKTTGYEKQRVTVMLCITADGHKLPPYLILNRKTIPKNETFPKDVIVCAQKNGWMTSEMMDNWIDVIWNRRPGALRNPCNILVIDAFKGHTSEQIKKKLQNKNCDLVVIPSGMTSQLQPLDVSVNKPFKDYLRQEYEAWLFSENLPLTPSGKIRKAPASKVAEWVSAAWHKIPEVIVQRSFKKCCITNALDGSEDDILWENHDNDHNSSSDDSNSENGDLTDEVSDEMSGV